MPYLHGPCGSTLWQGWGTLCRDERRQRRWRASKTEFHYSPAIPSVVVQKLFRGRKRFMFVSVPGRQPLWPSLNPATVPVSMACLWRNDGPLLRGQCGTVRIVGAQASGCEVPAEIVVRSANDLRTCCDLMAEGQCGLLMLPPTNWMQQNGGCRSKSATSLLH